MKTSSSGLKNTYPNRPKAILFDYDGVLVSSEPIHLLAWRQLLAEMNLSQDLEFVQASIGKTAPQILAGLLDQYVPGWTPAQYDLQKLATRKNQFYLADALQRLQPYPGVREGLKWLKEQKIPVAVVSNARRLELESTLVQLQLTEYFAEIVSRDDVQNSKPDPTHYLFAAAALGVPITGCIAVEDSPTGLEAALLSGALTVAITTTFSKATVEQPIPGRPDLSPFRIEESMIDFFTWLRGMSQ
jgi:beta-phosphoglucomutase